MKIDTHNIDQQGSVPRITASVSVLEHVQINPLKSRSCDLQVPTPR